MNQQPYLTLCLPDDEAALPREETSLHGLRDDSRFIPFSLSLDNLPPFTGDTAACRQIVRVNKMSAMYYKAFSALTLLVGWHVKTEWWGAGMVICLQRGADLHMAQLIPLPLSLASVKSRLVLPFWYRLTWVVPEKGPLNVCVCVCVCVRACVRACLHLAPDR